MHKFCKSIGFFAVMLGVATGADAATARSGANVARMPTMPTMPINTIGNISTGSGGAPVPSVPSNPGNPGNPGGPGKPGGPTTPINPVNPCPDDGVQTSDYTVENCMNDILMCINNGGLPGGLNDMFDENLRNSIMNGMNLCYTQVDQCVREVREDCKNIYLSSSDVWNDFNSRRVQPEYYSFVLRKTGLTPNQAENTCWLLDKNTYGNSFTAVSNSNTVTGEYAKSVGAYNLQNNGTLTKANPMGSLVNNGNPGVDGNRGHYARWDATAGECLVRVAAYNKDKHISNSWLFGAVGNDDPAEVWRGAGSTFSCNKDLFGFNLMNQTKTAAVVGIGGGTVLGAGIGAIAGHGNENFDCGNEKHRQELTKELRANGNNVGILNQYLPSTTTAQVGAVGADITLSQCNEIIKLVDRYEMARNALTIPCNQSDVTTTPAIAAANTDFSINVYMDGGIMEQSVRREINGVVVEDTSSETDTRKASINVVGDATAECRMALDNWVGTQTFSNIAIAQSAIDAYASQIPECAPVAGRPATTAPVSCNSYKQLNLAIAEGGREIYCNTNADCITRARFDDEIAQLSFIGDLEIINGRKTNMGKSIGIGAAAGAGAGGLATAITAFVEKNNISCRIGDGLDTVGYGKSGSVDSLRDFYIKWNLRLPDTIMPTGTATDCDSWASACATLKDANQCHAAAINYRGAKNKAVQLVNGACTMSGSVCIENRPVAKSFGACK